jgi:hypothetical protein
MGGFVLDRNVVSGSLTPSRFSPDLQKYTLCNFNSLGWYSTAATGYADPTGATAAINNFSIPAEVGGVLQGIYHMLGAGQTKLKPLPLAGGLDWALDLVDDEGVEVNFGVIATNVARGKHVYEVGGEDSLGKNRGFFASLTLAIADVSGTDDCAFGFRKVAAQAAIDDYTDFAVFNIISGDIKTESANDDAATTTTDTTDNWADAAIKKLTVIVDGEGVVSFQVDGARPTVAPNPSFDIGDSVFPFFYLLHDATSPGAITFSRFEAGYLPLNVR